MPPQNAGAHILGGHVLIYLGGPAISKNNLWINKLYSIDHAYRWFLYACRLIYPVYLAILKTMYEWFTVYATDINGKKCHTSGLSFYPYNSRDTNWDLWLNTDVYKGFSIIVALGQNAMAAGGKLAYLPGARKRHGILTS